MVTPGDAAEGGDGAPRALECALAWSGGKDAALALHRARQRGYRVSHLFTIYEGNTRRTRFHGLRIELLEAQAASIGLPLIVDCTHPDDYAGVHRRLLDRLAEAGVQGLVYGNIHLEDVRAWFEERSVEAGFEHVEPLWGDPPAQLVREFLTAGYRALVVSVNLERGDPDWLGKELEGDVVAGILGDPDVDPCGEHGEYHTFAWDGPLYARPVDFRRGEVFEREGHRILDLELREPPADADGPEG